MFKKILIFLFFVEICYCNDLSNAIDNSWSWSGNTSNLSADGETSNNPQIALNGDRSIAIWYRSNGNKLVVQTSYSDDGGKTWHNTQESATNLSDDAQNAYAPQIALDGDRAVAIWRRDNGSKYVIQTSYSDDKGETWKNTQVNATDLSDDAQNATKSQIVLDGDNAIAIWQRFNGSTLVIQTSYSDNGGKTWYNKQENATNLSDGTQYASNPQIALDGNNAIAVWTLNEDNVQTSYSNDYGKNWSTAENLAESLGDEMSPQIALDGNNSVAIWPKKYNNFVAQTRYGSPFVTNFRQFYTKSFLERGYINELRWNEITEANNYRIYKTNNEGVLSNKIFEGTDSKYVAHKIKEGERYTYYIVWVDDQQQESSPVEVIIQ